MITANYLRKAMCLKWIAVALLAAKAFSQNPPGGAFALGAKDGRTSFRLGESIAVEFQFQSGTPGQYRIVTSADKRVVRIPQYDQFLVEPKENAVDPLRDMPALMEGGVSGFGPTSLPLTNTAVKIDREVNEWISIRKPGKYRITAETKRLISTAQPPGPVTLRSNTIEIEVTAPEPGWASEQIKNAVAALELGDQPNAIGQIFDNRRERQMERAARVLRFLETPDAARTLVRFFESRPQASQRDLRAGLFGSPYRTEVISAMEDGLADPHRPVTYYWIATLIELAAAPNAPLQGPYPANDPVALKQWMAADRVRLEQYKPVESRYFAKLGNAVWRKQGEARAVSLQTLLLRGPQPAPASVLSALIENFQDLPPGTQQMLLSTEWPRIGSPSLKPFLRSVAEGRSPARDEALMRLQDLDPEIARKIVLDRVRRGDVNVEAGGYQRVLMLLPDKTLLELDDALASALEQGKPAETLLARYATGAVFGRVQALFEKPNRFLCGGPIFAWFFRIDPVYAASRLAQARTSSPGGCALYTSPYEDLLMSPGLEQAAIRDLASPNPMVERSAQTLLQHAGSPQAEQPLWDALERFRVTSGPGPMNSGLEFGFTEALLKGNGWILTSEKIDRLAAACITDGGRSFVNSERRALMEPIRISLLMAGPVEGTLLGPFLLRSHRQLLSKIGQFPRGTKFRFEAGYQGTWYGDTRKSEIRQVLRDAGMQVEDPPAGASKPQ